MQGRGEDTVHKLVLYMRNQVYLSSFDDIDSSIPQAQSTLPTSVLESTVDESAQTCDDSWLQDIDEQGDDINLLMLSQVGMILKVNKWGIRFCMS